MSVLEVINGLSAVEYPLYFLGFALPVVVYLVGRFSDGAETSRVFGHVASGLIALGLLTMAFDVGICIYLSSKGVDLMSDVQALALVTPFWFGLGTLWAACQVVPFEQLRTYPLLKRVWSILSLGAVIIVALMILKHTFWLVFSGILGFVVVALLFWSVVEKLLGNVFSSGDSEDSENTPQ